MGILDKILGISSAKEKLNEYREYLAEMDDIDKSATACSDEFMIENLRLISWMKWKRIKNRSY